MIINMIIGRKVITTCIYLSQVILDEGNLSSLLGHSSR